VKWSQRTAWDRSENPLGSASGIDLTVSNPTLAGFAPPPAILAALSDPRAMHYEPTPFGLGSARDAVRAYYAKRNRCADEVLLTASTSEAYFLLFTLLCDPGSRVLVPAPSYPLFSYLADVASVTPVPYPLRYDGEWHIDFAAMDRALEQEDVRAIIVVSPNNPTGHFTTAQERKALDERALERGLAVIVDEVFLDYALDTAPPALPPPLALTFTLSGLSKVALLPQLKLGWCVVEGAGTEEAMARLEILLDTFLSVNGPVQHALPSLLAYGDTLHDKVRTRLKVNLQLLRASLEHSTATVLRCDAGFSAIIRVPNTLDDEQWCLRLREHGVSVQPGHFFDLAGGPYLVVSLLSAQFAAGAERLASVFKRLT
jgi:alanine-synthesizing transaminase